MAIAVNPFVNKSALKRKSFCGANTTKQIPFTVSFAPNKKLCISPPISRRSSNAALYSSSSSDEDRDDDSDSELGYLNNQRRARKRAFSMKRSNSISDMKLSALSKFSDEEDERDEFRKGLIPLQYQQQYQASSMQEHHQSLPLLKMQHQQLQQLQHQHHHHHQQQQKQHQHQQKQLRKQRSSISNEISPANSRHVSEVESRNQSSSNSQLFSQEGKNFNKKSHPELDLAARNRCFEYLVGSIDEAWARYCESTSHAEEEAYKDIDYLPNTPASLAPSEFEDEDNYEESGDEDEDNDDNDKNEKENNEDEDESEDKDEDEKSNSYQPQHGKRGSFSKCSFSGYSSDVELRRVSSHPGNLRLQQLKDRLLKAKHFLVEFLDSTESQEAMSFWKRWDLVKYATIELVEDDDDDEVIESTIDELEKGRLYGCF